MLGKQKPQFNRSRLWVTASIMLGAIVSTGFAQQQISFKLGDGPWIFDTYEPQTRIRVSVVTKGLIHPWSLVFVGSEDILVSERAGTLRIIRSGILDEKPIPGIPRVLEASSGGLMDITLHPKFDTNRLVYFVYLMLKKNLHLYKY